MLEKTLSGMHLYTNIVDNGVLPGIVGFKWLWVCEAFCSAVWSVERVQLIMIGYQTKLSQPLLAILVSFSLRHSDFYNLYPQSPS